LDRLVERELFQGIFYGKPLALTTWQHKHSA
jgi:hypothetical protein